MNLEDFTNNIQEKIGKDEAGKIADDIANILSYGSSLQQNIESKDNYSEMYATLEFQVNNKVVETKILHMKDIIAKQEFNYMIQSSMDLTETDDWQVNIVTEEAATSVGYTQAEE